VVVGATNRVGHLDEAIKRKGRFDRKVKIGYPDAETRKEILEVHLDGLPVSGEIEWDKILEETEGMSGSELKALVEDAAREALQEGEDICTEHMLENSSDEVKSEDNEGPELKEVPGIGGVRADSLREDGYRTATDVAEASVSELSEIDNISHDAATCVRETARDVCGYDDTLAAELVEEFGVDRDRIASAYAELAPSIVTPKEAEPTLRHLFNNSDQTSVLRLESYSLKYRHLLFKSGFERLEDISEADSDSLTNVRYIGENLAANIRQASEKKLEELD